MVSRIMIYLSSNKMKRTVLAIECLLLFGVVPILLWYISIQGILFLTLWTLAIPALWIWKRQTGLSRRAACFRLPHLTGPILRRIVMRFAAIAAFLLAFTIFYDPARLFEFPRERTGVWAIIMVLYPLLSVFPQEILYRLFFFERYAPLFPNERMMTLMSGVAFGHAHIVFNNWVAYSMCIAGGLLFARTYSKTRSFPIVWIEHAIYGCFIFTVGLGFYFYSGAANLH